MHSLDFITWCRGTTIQTLFQGQLDFISSKGSPIKISAEGIWVLPVGGGSKLEHITFEILAAERLRLMAFDNRLIIDCFANVENVLILQFSTNDRFKSEKHESITWKIHFQKLK